MISAKLIKNLEKLGFSLDFPGYASNDELIMEIFRLNNPRLDEAIPIILKEGFSYDTLSKKLPSNLKNKLDRMIAISAKIYEKLGIPSDLPGLMSSKKIFPKITSNELEHYYDIFAESMDRASLLKEGMSGEELEIRSKLNTAQALSIIFSDGKMRIMDKIFNHKELSNTELKYYYRAIRPLCRAILNENLQKYARIIESSKKLSDKK